MNNRRRSRARAGRDRSLATWVAVLCAGGALPFPAHAEQYDSINREKYGSGLGQEPLPTGLTVEPRADVSLQYAANLDLAADGEPQIDMAGIEAAPGFYAAYSSARATGVLDYALIARAWEDSDYNDVSQRLAGNGRWAVAPGWFYLLGDASYRDAVIDPAQSRHFGGLGIFGSSNLAEVATLSVSPTLQHAFGAFEGLARYTYGRLWHFDVPDDFDSLQQQDSVDEAARLSFGTREAARPYGFTLAYDWQQTEYETSLPYQYERLGLDTHWLVGGGVSLLAGGGVESDLEEDSSSGGLDTDFWNVGLRWRPDERTSAEARYGQRFFGDSYSVLISRQQRIFEFQASYAEDPEVRTRRQSLAGFEPGELPPGTPEDDYIGNAGQPYVGKNARVSVGAQGSRTALRLSVNRFERDYLSGDLADDVRANILLTARRDLASNLKGEFDIRYSEFERTQSATGPDPDLTTDYSDYEFIVRVKRDMGRSLTATAETGYLERTGDTEYDGWWVALRLRYVP